MIRQVSTTRPTATQTTARETQPEPVSARKALRGFGKDELSTGEGSALRRRAARLLGSGEASRPDRSMARSLEALQAPVSGKAMARALLEGLSDIDGQSTSRELQTAVAWAAANEGRMTDEAKKVVEVYARRAGKSRERGHDFFTNAELSNLRERLKEVAKGDSVPETTPPPTDPPPPPAGDDDGKVGPKERRRELYEYALKHPNEFFKRQGQHARFNPNPDELGGYDGKNSNCGPTSLAMAVKAFGLERPSFSKDKRNGIEDSIDLARNAMTVVHGKWNTTAEPRSNDTSTDNDERVRGARRLGLKTDMLDTRPGHTLDSLDRAFKEHKMVMLNGVPGPGAPNRSAYQQAMQKAYPGYDFDGGHTILVMGKDKHGNYLVADPLSRRGVVHMSARELASYQESSAMAVWR